MAKRIMKERFSATAALIVSLSVFLFAGYFWVTWTYAYYVAAKSSQLGIQKPQSTGSYAFNISVFLLAAGLVSLWIYKKLRWKPVDCDHDLTGSISGACCECGTLVTTSKFENVSPKRNFALIAFVIHSMIACIVFLLVHVNWGRTYGSMEDVWFLFLIIDFPVALVYFLADEIAFDYGASPYFRFAFLPFLIVLIAGGFQWYWVTRLILGYPFKEPDPMVCSTCEYNLTGNESGTCPECGEAI
ncbi:MAG: hypothetical protein DHS20C16_14400 [Phycisphaerae bacterium]|nr:MAG: hypothetical protein DHS20C16_14400 [Phycisphaerae bacterium]